MQATAQQRRTGRPLALCAFLTLVGAGVAWARRPVSKASPPPAPEPLPGRPRLVQVIGGSMPHGHTDQPDESVLREGRQVLGRARDADVHLADLSVSPRHALVEADREGRVVIRDLGALNGLTVDGIPVAEAELHDGNRIQLGDVQMVYRTDPLHDSGGRSGGELGENVTP